jgi:hypothetical protein
LPDMCLAINMAPAEVSHKSHKKLVSVCLTQIEFSIIVITVRDLLSNCEGMTGINRIRFGSKFHQLDLVRRLEGLL